MLKSQMLILSLGIILIHGCSGAEDKTYSNKIKNTQKTILIECKSNQKEGFRFFNSKIEVFPMTDDVLTTLNQTKIEEKVSKSDVPIYAVIKNIELFNEKTSIKNSCKNRFFYGNVSLENFSSSYEIKLSPISKNCNYNIFLSFKELTLLQPFSNPPKKIEDAPFVSNCSIIK